jgi:type I restriction enzyme S subunit
MAKQEGKTTSRVPKLRFPEFRGADGWKEAPLGDCLDYQQPTPYLVSETNYSPTFKTPVLTAGKTFILGYTDEEHGIFADGLPVIIFDDFTTATQFVDFPFKAKSSAMKILQAKPDADIKFMYETLQNLSYEVGAHERHWIATFAPMRVPVPSPAEQRKIAACLTSLDALIAARGRKLAALAAHKKGLMQQLFPRPGEPLPRLRFPEFREGWEPTPFNKLYEFQSTNNYSRDQLTYESGNVKNIHYGDIHTRFQTSFRLAHETVPYVNGSLASDEFDADAYCVEGDMIFADASEDLNDVGKSIEIVSLNGEQLVSGSHTILARPKPKGIAIGFGAYLFKSRSVRAQIEKEAQGTKVMQISPRRLAGITLLLPRDKAEQQRIAACLGSLDAALAAEAQALTALRTHKKGLMQQLFPSPEGD